MHRVFPLSDFKWPLGCPGYIENQDQEPRCPGHILCDPEALDSLLKSFQETVQDQETSRLPLQRPPSSYPVIREKAVASFPSTT